MKAELQIEIVTPARRIFQGSCEEAYLPGERGEFGVLAEHAPLISLLSPGCVRVQEKKGQTQIAVRAGLVQVQENRIMVLADEAFRVEDIDAQKLEAESQRVEEQLGQADVEEEIRDQLFEEREWVDVRRRLRM